MKKETQNRLEHLCHCMEWRIASEGAFSPCWSPSVLALLRCVPAPHITCAQGEKQVFCNTFMKRLHLAYTVFTTTKFLSQCALNKCIN